MTDHWLILGAGGHGKVVLDILLCCGNRKDWISFVDANAAGEVYGIRILRPLAAMKLQPCKYVIAIGDCRARSKVYNDMLVSQHMMATVQHPSATVSQFATIDPGAMICAGANVGPGSKIGRGTIINTGANVDHDCSVGEFSHIAPHATLCGGVRVGSKTLVGAGAVIKPGTLIGCMATIGCGATVVRNVPDKQTQVGTPAKELSKK